MPIAAAKKVKASKDQPSTCRPAVEIRPNSEPQRKFLATAADIAIYGGSAGSGKSWGLRVEPLRHTGNPGFGCVIFRRTTAQVRKQGGLWDASQEIYPAFGAKPREQQLDWTFPSGSRISFSHIEHDKNVHDWDSAEIPLIEFDELQQFSRTMFYYMLSRNRSTCGIRPYVRASCNPDADSWLAEFLAWWIDQETGFPIPGRSGVIRWFAKVDVTLHWADTREELVERFGPETEPKSVTFIAASIHDNADLLAKDPGYLANLKALDKVERERLLGGNWKVRAAAGKYFQRRYFEIVDAAPATCRRVRAWDLAATEESEGDDPDWTAGLKLARDPEGILYVEHVERFRGSPGKVKTAIKNCASSDGGGCKIRLPQDPGQAGKAQVDDLIRSLVGYSVTAKPVSGDKVTRAGPASAQAEAGNIRLVRGDWNDAFLAELEAFPSRSHDDQVDALSDAVAEIAAVNEPRIRQL